ncbi:hypothetical protein QFC20_001287 [Naganishia adeliensis]|uniref:Uncharacterized protein n=1 Tax=Naganishia adeliensis TaxID=92952 RepID=A0ACC2WUT2_9TREE|nr:hypothetical protein QFC20_001287 [Naganishia adeliensis]
MASLTPAPVQATNGTQPPAGEPAQKSKNTAADVGWQFVPQYYTMLNEAPERLHCFYNKKSTFVHGVEGEDVPTSYGQQQIHQRVISLGFSNCKAFIHHIDAQPSFSGGIVLQVIGEISNASGPWRKFTQTFFLAGQPNGYFVLNDIFRYLKEEDEEHDEGDDEDSVAAEQVEETEQPAAPVEEQPVADKSSMRPPLRPSELAESTPPVAEAPETVVPKEETPAVTEPQQEPATSEPAKEESKEEPVSAEETVPAPEPVVEAEKPAPAAPEPEKEAPVQQQQPKPTPPSETQRQSPAPRGKPAPAPAPAAAPTPAAPPKPRTWASTAAAKPNAWGTALATKEALSASASAPAVPAGVQRTASAQKTAQQQPKQGQTAQPASAPAVQTSGHKYPLVEAAKAVQTPICFIKLNNWQAQDATEQITESELRQILSKYAGVPGSEITKVEIVRDKACAFVEFAKVDAARRAIIASLLTAQGGGGGIKTDGGHRIIVESRKEKSERKSGAAGSPIIGGPAPQQAQVTGQAPAQGQQGQGQGPRRQGQNQNQQNQNQNQNQNRASQGGAGMRGGRQQGRTGQAQGANQK